MPVKVSSMLKFGEMAYLGHIRMYNPRTIFGTLEKAYLLASVREHLFTFNQPFCWEIGKNQCIFFHVY